MAAKFGQCKLCGEVSVKLVHSHIIPESFYFQLQDQQGMASKVLSEDAYPQRVPKGLYGQFMCAECEEKLGPWDDYAYKLLKVVTPVRMLEQSGNGDHRLMGFEYESIDYGKLKLFFMSLLWRAHVTENPFFERVCLPELSAEELRLAIYNRTAMRADKYTVALGKSEQMISNVVPVPFMEDIDGTTFCRIYLPGYVVHIKIDDNPMPKSLFLHMLYPGSGLVAYYYDYKRGGEVATAYAMVKKNLRRKKR